MLQKVVRRYKGFSLKKRRIIKIALFVIPLAVVGTALLLRIFAASPQGTYTSWNWSNPPDGYDTLEHSLIVEAVTENAPYFWSHQFVFVDGDGGYMGLQSNGNRVDGTVGKTAVFSIFKAGIEGTPGACSVEQDNFDGYDNTAGTSCRIPFDWQLGHQYHFKVIKSGQDASGTNWTAHITDQTTGAVTNIATIKTPPQWKGIGHWSNMWSEYFGTHPTMCEGLPYSRVRFFSPTANNGTAAPSSKLSHVDTNAECRNSKVTDLPDGSLQEMGINNSGPDNIDPEGFLDAATCQSVWGWARDNDNPNVPVTVHIYVDHQLVDGVVADQYGADVGSHRFSYTFPSAYSGSHSVQVYGLSLNSTGGSGNESRNRLLNTGDVPMNMEPCNTPPPPPSDTEKPQVSITQPVNGGTVSGDTTILATATDNTGVTNVSGTIDNQPVDWVALNGSYTASWNTAGLANGNHTITFSAFDAASNQGTASITVNLQHATANTAPSSPAGLQAVAASPTSASLSWAAASDENGDNMEYIVSRQTGSGSFMQIGQVTTLQFIDSGLTASTTYTYHVTAQETDTAEKLSSTPSESVTVTTSAQCNVFTILLLGSVISGYKNQTTHAEIRFLDANINNKIDILELGTAISAYKNARCI